MSWSKGAVVIRKYGDQDWADSFEESLTPKPKKPMPKRRTTEQLVMDMIKAERQYGRNWTPPKWARWIFEGGALFTYGVCLCIEKLSRKEARNGSKDMRCMRVRIQEGS